MYPDFLSLDAGYVGQMYKNTGKIITMMGWRKPVAHVKPFEPLLAGVA